ncbi:unnamed protein product [Amoebophrya sp. A25]|nr:unnamed protein product [Amoebophrya sp. A25]|eukprot:GSA25T00022538001.1
MSTPMAQAEAEKRPDPIPEEWALIENDPRPGRLQVEAMFDYAGLLYLRFVSCATFFRNVYVFQDVLAAQANVYCAGKTYQAWLETLLGNFFGTWEVLQDHLKWIPIRRLIVAFCFASFVKSERITTIEKQAQALDQEVQQMQQAAFNPERAALSKPKEDEGAQLCETGFNTKSHEVLQNFNRAVVYFAPLLGRLTTDLEDGYESD